MPTFVHSDDRSRHLRLEVKISSPKKGHQRSWQPLQADNETTFSGISNGNLPSMDGNILASLLRWFQASESHVVLFASMIWVVGYILLRAFVVELRFTRGASMNPTLQMGDRFIVEKVTKRIRKLRRKEVIVFFPPDRAGHLCVHERKAIPSVFVKRIVAVAGDVAEMRDGKLYVNGIEQSEPYSLEEAAYYFGPITVPGDTLLVLGDNRNISFDSHIWGFLPEDHVIGRATIKYWPIPRAGKVGLF